MCTVLDIFAELDDIDDDGLDAHDVTHKSVPIEFDLRLNVLVLLGHQRLNGGSYLVQSTS